MYTLSKLILFMLILISLEEKPDASQGINYDLLRDLICDEIETPGEPYPDFSVGKVTSQRGGLPWGRCQIKYWTAVRAGFPTNRNPGDLFKKSTNREFSKKILKMCAKALKRRRIPETARTISHCYGSGYHRRYPKSKYSRDVSRIYTKQMKENRILAKEHILSNSYTNYILEVRVTFLTKRFLRLGETKFQKFIVKIRAFVAKYLIREPSFSWEI